MYNREDRSEIVSLPGKSEELAGMLIAAIGKTKHYCAKYAMTRETEHHVQVLLCPNICTKSTLAHSASITVTRGAPTSD